MTTRKTTHNKRARELASAEKRERKQQERTTMTAEQRSAKREASRPTDAGFKADTDRA
jgi:hypothetical protein